MNQTSRHHARFGVLLDPHGRHAETVDDVLRAQVHDDWTPDRRRLSLMVVMSSPPPPMWIEPQPIVSSDKLWILSAERAVLPWVVRIQANCSPTTRTTTA